jgi:hypothetical protein
MAAIFGLHSHAYEHQKHSGANSSFHQCIASFVYYIVAQ